MMNMLEEAIIYATVLHQGKVRKFNGIPYILHPMEVAQILSTMTDDQEIITAGLEAAGLQDGYTADQIRESLTVSGEYPETYLEQMTRYVSLLTGGADTEQTVSAGFRPTQYSVQLSSSFNRKIMPEAD